MTKKEENKSIIEICPIRNVIARFGNKWALLVIFILNENDSIRFNQLARKIPDISTKVLSSTLHILEADGLVKRTVFPEVPIRVEYELTETGKSLVPIITSLTEWAQNNKKSIMNHRKKFENSTSKSD
ncbi:MAG: helix-turn-helix domain-containing protein [Phocaeicola sp.]|nr:helix-turn-helix transcriptional regulator [Phocaeicola sp.]MDD7448079.1 helix-turn-helix domain-containing protein [Prevotellaceae bacterium]MDY3913886.1 helix-turn-helix domain-containing protein [Phocaeicola sp.]MDY5938740.1 helix-turn-helix domain-containing protein [Phocaeicola sp.]